MNPSQQDLDLLATYQQLLQHYPRDVTVHLLLAKHYSKLQDWQGALGVCEEIFQLDPDHQPTLLLFGEVAARSGMKAGLGIQCLKRMIALQNHKGHPYKSRALNYLGMLLDKSG